MSTTTAPSSTPPRTFSLFGHDYTMRDPAAYGTDAMLQETRKAYYLTLYPKDRDVIRSEFRERYAAWLDSIEDSPTNDVLVIAAIMVPTVETPATGGNDPKPAISSPDLLPETLLAMRSWDVADAIAEPLRFFHPARLEAYVAYLASKGPGESSTMESAPTISINSTSMSDRPIETTATPEPMDPTTESTSPSNTRNE